jgi:hypothetical protein
MQFGHLTGKVSSMQYGPCKHVTMIEKLMEHALLACERQLLSVVMAHTTPWFIWQIS